MLTKQCPKNREWLILILSYFFLHIRKLSEGEDFSILKLTYKNKEYYITNPKTLTESIDTLFSFFLVRVFHHKTHKVRSSKRAKALLYFIVIAIALITYFAFYLITHIIPNP